jgi:hypothetical protein
MIEDKIKEIATYFKGKLLKGDYEFLSCDKHTAKIRIDGKYDMEIWIANSPPASLLEVYNNVFPWENVNIPDQFKLSQKEKDTLWANLSVFIEKYRKEELIKQKEQSIKQIQKELKQLKNK